MKNATVTMTIDEFKEMEKLVELGKFVTDFNEKTKELEKREKEVIKAEGKVKVVTTTFGFIATTYKNMEDFEEKQKSLEKDNMSIRCEISDIKAMSIREFRKWRENG